MFRNYRQSVILSSKKTFGSEYSKIKSKLKCIKNLNCQIQYPVLNHRTILQAAIDFKDNNFINHLLFERKVDPNIETDIWSSALHRAIKDKNFLVVCKLIEAGADVNRWSTTRVLEARPLFFAIQEENYQIIEILIKNGTDVNEECLKDARPLFSSLPLEIAIEKKSPKLVSFLLAQGADVNVTGPFNRTLLDKADLLKDRAISDLIQKHVVKLRAADLYVSKENLSKVSHRIDLRQHCQDEVEMLKKLCIGDSNLSYYSLLHKSVHQLVLRLKYVKDADINDGLNLLIDGEFVNYKQLLRCKLEKVVYRKKFVERSYEVISEILGEKLPDLFIRNLLHYISSCDLMKLK